MIPDPISTIGEKTFDELSYDEINFFCQTVRGEVKANVNKSVVLASMEERDHAFCQFLTYRNIIIDWLVNLEKWQNYQFKGVLEDKLEDSEVLLVHRYEYLDHKEDYYGILIPTLGKLHNAIQVFQQQIGSSS